MQSLFFSFSVLVFLTLFVLLPAIARAAEGAGPADRVFVNGRIYTADEDFTVAEALAVKGDKLVYVGSVKGAEPFTGSGTEVTDLHGMTVIPGLIEGHMHINGLGESLLQIDAFRKPKETILASVKAEAERSEPGSWIVGQGWMNTVWEDSSYPAKEELDRVAPDNPVFLMRADEHMCWVNGKALELAGITGGTADPDGGEYLRTESGELLGCATDTAMEPIAALLPPYTAEQRRKALLLAQDELFSYGITSAANAGTSVETLNEVYMPLYVSGELKLRAYLLIYLTDSDCAGARYISGTAPKSGLFGGRLSVRGVKIFGDGSLGARSAAMLEEYRDRPGHFGNYRYGDDEMYGLVKLAYKHGYQTAIHAIGDGANRQALNVYERILKENPNGDTRPRIEHFQIVAPEDIERAKELGVLPSMQATHATSDMQTAEEMVGPLRMAGAYAWRTILDGGNIIIGGSDAPVELVNPFHGIYAAVTRRDRSGEPDGGWRAEERMTRREALRSFTNWPAYGEFCEALKGSLEAGKLADFVFIDRDIMSCPEDEIKDIQVLMTVCGGETVYERDHSVPSVVWKGEPLKFNGRPFAEDGEVYAPMAEVASGAGVSFEIRDGLAHVRLEGKCAQTAVKKTEGVYFVPVAQLFRSLGRKVRYCRESNCLSIGRQKR